jgi:hypothetical protein
VGQQPATQAAVAEALEEPEQMGQVLGQVATVARELQIRSQAHLSHVAEALEPLTAVQMVQVAALTLAAVLKPLRVTPVSL